MRNLMEENPKLAIGLIAAITLAVIVPSGAISPCHGKVALKGAWQKSNYTVGRSNEDRDLFNRSSAAHGEYVLARAPKDAGRFQIDVRTGSVAKSD